MLSTLTRDGLRRLTKNRNRSGNVVEYIRGRGGTCEVSRDERAWVSPATPLLLSKCVLGGSIDYFKKPKLDRT